MHQKEMNPRFNCAISTVCIIDKWETHQIGLQDKNDYTFLDLKR